VREGFADAVSITSTRSDAATLDLSTNANAVVSAL
jgi:hypothetical protein